MTKKLRKTLATLLAVSMILSTVSISAFAETPEDTTPAPAAEEIKEEKEVETEKEDAVLDGTQADTDEIDTAPQTLSARMAAPNVDDAKFAVVVSSTLKSGEKTYVYGTVGADYQAKLVLPGTRENKAKVNAGNATIKVVMNDVATLGGGEKVFEKSLTTGVDKETTIANNVEGLYTFSGTTVNATIKDGAEEKTVTYSISGAMEEDGNTVITGTTSEDAARAAWQLLTSNIEAGSKDEDDSYIEIAPDSWLQIGKDLLVFEDDVNQPLKLDNITADNLDALEAEIRAAVKLETAEDDALAFCLGAGTTLALSNSAATLTKDVVVTVTGANMDALRDAESGESILSDLRDGALSDLGGEDTILYLLGMLEMCLDTVDGQNLNVTIEFLCDHSYDAEHVTWSWNGYSAATATFACTKCGEEVEVEAEVTSAGRVYTATATLGDVTATDTRTRPAPTPTPDDEELGEDDTPLADRPWMFEDVSENDWYYNAVRNMFNLGVIGGVSATQFAPNVNADRGTVAQILYRVVGKPAVTGEALKDVKANAWYRDASIWACAEGVFEGYSNGNFGGDDVITREQLVTVLYRYAQKKGFAVTERSDLSGFRDADKVSGWSAEAMCWAVGAGILTGRSATTLAPQSNTTRGELTIILNRFVEKFPGIVPANGVAE